MNNFPLKTIKITNNNNVLVQIPKAVIDLWNINNGDSLEMFLNDNKEIILKPRGGFLKCIKEKLT